MTFVVIYPSKRLKFSNSLNAAAAALIIVLLACSSLPVRAQFDQPEAYRHESDCYDSVTGAAKKCMPEFVNAAYGLKIIASNTCGSAAPTEYCVQSNLHNSFNRGGGGTAGDGSRHPVCEVCDANDRRYAHPAEYLNDYNNQGNITWWQSETMVDPIQYPNSVNLTLNLGKAFDINYVQIKFHSPRPESFAIYKRTTESSTWVPYQYYSASCEKTYGVRTGSIVMRHNEAVALCTDEFSDIAPLTGASVVFGTLEDRPSAYNFENSAELKEWVTATDIRITLNRLNTFGDEVFNDPQVLRSYYYAISDIAVGGRCKCNGHASRCEYEQQHDFEDRLKCVCEHNTAGVDCGECLPFFNDVPWAPATQLNAHECKACSCNGLSRKCYFDLELYERTGHGGHCIDCEGNTAGVHCEECKEGFYRRENENRCIDCHCHYLGSESPQCDPTGKCRCRPGVVGDKCDRCAPNHYDLSIVGCKLCMCNTTGSLDSPPVCDARDGSCRCKANVEGQNCDRPKPGFFDLAEDHIHGAIPCFCYGHSSQCNSSDEYFVYTLSGRLDDLNNKLKAVDSRGSSVEVNQLGRNGVSVYISSPSEEVWFLAPSQFTGNQRLSYNQDLTFEMRIFDSQTSSGNLQGSVRPSRKDIIIESEQYGIEVYLPIYGSNQYPSTSNLQSLPSSEPQTFRFKLNQYAGWMPTMTPSDFQRLLSNVSAIKIRASYVPMARTLLSKLNLVTARHISQKTEADEIGLDEYGQLIKKPVKVATFVEKCTCPVGYTGQHCERCAFGYRREPVNGGPFSRCVPCTCNNHSLSCDPDTGRCDCLHHTTGEYCEKCEEGYYGNSLLAAVSSNNNNGPLSEYELANMCKKCPCPSGGSCAEIYNYQLQNVEVVCLNCPPGTQGNLCELCDDGFYNPGQLGSSPCQRCLCNGNIDENAIGNCDTQAQVERCTRCIFNTTGEQCERCLEGYWGNALTPTKCHACECFEPGTMHDEGTGQPRQCDLTDGQCECKANVKNRQCNECKDGFWNILSGKGCEECRCNPLGSFNHTCNAYNGQCHCRPGVEGLKCDRCKATWFGFSDEGCKKCDCDPFGTAFGELQCDEFGKCKCRENFAGLKCNKCDENFYNFTSGCLKCDDCYNLVQTKVVNLRERIFFIEKTLNEMLSLSSSQLSDKLNDENLELQEKLKSLKLLVEDLHQQFFVKRNLKPSYAETINFLQNEVKRIADGLKSNEQAFEPFSNTFKQAERFYDLSNNSIIQAQTQLNFISAQNERQAEMLRQIKQSRLEHEQNRKLQSLAKQARETADRQKEFAQNVTDELQRTLVDAQKSYQQMQIILNKYDRFDEEKHGEAFNLNYELLKNKTVYLADEARQARKALDDSVSGAKALIKRLDEFKVPDENSNANSDESTKQQVSELNAKSASMKKEIDDLKLKIEQFSNVDSLNSIGSAQTQINTAKIRQKDIDYLLNVAERARNETDLAIRLADEIFKNATKIQQTLEEFDKTIMEGKDELERAKNLRPETEENIKSSNNLLRQVQQKLVNLNAQIDEIKKSSSASILTLQEANSTTERLISKVNDLKSQTAKLEEKASKMAKNFETVIQPKAEEALSVHSGLNSRSQSIQRQAEQVAEGTQKLFDNANNALENLNKINKSISEYSVSNIRKEDITRLQRKFVELSSQMDSDSKLDESIGNLERSTKSLLNKAKQYELEVEYLREQVKDLDNINVSLKRECYANTVAKPEL